MQVNQVEQGQRPVFCRETGTVEEGASADRKFAVIYLNGAVLRGTVGSCRLEDISVLAQEQVPKST
jgi:hypothetical protein